MPSRPCGKRLAGDKVEQCERKEVMGSGHLEYAAAMGEGGGDEDPTVKLLIFDLGKWASV